MTTTVRVAVPRKGRPLEAVLERLDAGTDLAADDIVSTLRYEKAVTKGGADPERDVYERLAAYSDLDDAGVAEYTLLRDDRDGMPRRVVFDSVVARAPAHDLDIHLVGREEPFRALRTHAFGLGFDSADLVLEEVVSLRPEGVDRLAAVNDRIDPRESDVRVVAGLGDTVYHTLLATPETLPAGTSLDRAFVRDYAGTLCISPRYERLVEAVLGTDAVDGVEFVYPGAEREEEAAIADVGLGVYLTMTGATARERGLLLGEHLFPSETVLMENESESGDAVDALRSLVDEATPETAIEV
jgi:hypothetical protein